jgi:competence protein ComEA
MDGGGWQGLAWGIAVVVAVLIGVRMLSSPAESPPVRIGTGTDGTDRHRSASSPTGPYVHVAGAVRRPGLYRLPVGGRVAAAVRRAGGATADANLTAINLAAPLQDGQQVVVPSSSATGAVGPSGVAQDVPVSLGSATVEQLDELDGIGPTLAERIVEHRQKTGGFASIDQLGDVEGIGEKRLEALKQALTP